ncbi:MAG: DUF3142 domain-containing protein [Fimbriimonadaceae bacterium]
MSRWSFWSLLVSLLLLTGCAGSESAPAGPLSYGVWFWHSPYDLSAEDAVAMQRAGVDNVFVLAGTFSTDGERPQFVLPQSFASEASEMPVHLAFRFDRGYVNHFEEMQLKDQAELIAGAMAAQADAAREAGLTVAGVQTDMDVPSRLLPRYAELLEELHEELPEEWVLSSTALVTWLREPGAEAFARAVDFYVPQFYEAEVGDSPDDLTALADFDLFVSGLRAAEELGEPFYAGIPAYGHALMYDEEDELRGTYPGLTVGDAMRHDVFELERVTETEGGAERAVVLRAVQPGAQGEGLGWRLVYKVPRLGTTQRFLEHLRAARPSHCLGAILFRVPEPRESLVLPLAALLRAVKGEVPDGSLAGQIEGRVSPWGAIEGEAPEQALPAEVTVTLDWNAEVATVPDPEAIRLVVELNEPGATDVRLGTFDRVRVGTRAGGEFQETSLSRADTFVFSRAHAVPGEELFAGPILTQPDSATRVRVRASIKLDSIGTLQWESEFEPLVKLSAPEKTDEVATD